MSAAEKGKCPHRRKAPKVAAQPALRKTELIGLTDDGRMVLWDTGMVKPVNRFETSRSGVPFIDSGHYVIDWKGHAITVHCDNELRGGRWVVGVQFMCSRGLSIGLPREEVEAMLIGKVIRDPVVEAEISGLLRALVDSIAAQKDTPANQRGRIA